MGMVPHTLSHKAQLTSLLLGTPFHLPSPTFPQVLMILYRHAPSLIHTLITALGAIHNPRPPPAQPAPQPTH